MSHWRGDRALKAFRGPLLHCLDDPGPAGVRVEPDGEGGPVQYLPDALLLVSDGKVEQLGPAGDLLPNLPQGVEVVDHRDGLMVPGFVDCHIHYPQTEMIAAYGEQLLQWLERYTFPVEQAFHDLGHAREVANFFLDELLRNGTTTALVLGTVHKESVQGFFESAERRKMRMIAGKVLMDRHCPDYLRDTAESGYRDSRELIEQWHNRGRLGYALTPRFAPTSTPEQLALAGKLAGEFPDVHIHTHVAENRDEVAWVARLFPEARSYLDVYDRFNLLRKRSVYAHCIHLDKQDRQRMAEAGAAMAFCPTANLFLGSGLFDLEAVFELEVPVGMGSDVGGGTSFSMLRVLSEGYKVAQMAGQSISPWRALYLATLAGARALDLEDRIGNFQVGKEADFLVLDFECTPLLERRTRVARDLAEKLFALIMLGDDRVVKETYVLGALIYQDYAKNPAGSRQGWIA